MQYPPGVYLPRAITRLLCSDRWSTRSPLGHRRTWHRQRDRGSNTKTVAKKVGGGRRPPSGTRESLSSALPPTRHSSLYWVARELFIRVLLQSRNALLYQFTGFARCSSLSLAGTGRAALIDRCSGYLSICTTYCSLSCSLHSSVFYSSCEHNRNTTTHESVARRSHSLMCPPHSFTSVMYKLTKDPHYTRFRSIPSRSTSHRLVPLADLLCCFEPWKICNGLGTAQASASSESRNQKKFIHTHTHAFMALWAPRAQHFFEACLLVPTLVTAPSGAHIFEVVHSISLSPTQLWRRQFSAFHLLWHRTHILWVANKSGVYIFVCGQPLGSPPICWSANNPVSTNWLSLNTRTLEPPTNHTTT